METFGDDFLDEFRVFSEQDTCQMKEKAQMIQSNEDQKMCKFLDQYAKQIGKLEALTIFAAIQHNVFGEFEQSILKTDLGEQLTAPSTDEHLTEAKWKELYDILCHNARQKVQIELKRGLCLKKQRDYEQELLDVINREKERVEKYQVRVDQRRVLREIRQHAEDLIAFINS